MLTSTSIRSRSAICPDCGGEVRLADRVMIGEVFGCGGCGSQLEVASTDPPILETLAKIDEDESDFVQ